MSLGLQHARRPEHAHGVRRRPRPQAEDDVGRRRRGRGRVGLQLLAQASRPDLHLGPRPRAVAHEAGQAHRQRMVAPAVVVAGGGPRPTAAGRRGPCRRRRPGRRRRGPGPRIPPRRRRADRTRRRWRRSTPCPGSGAAADPFARSRRCRAGRRCRSRGPARAACPRSAAGAGPTLKRPRPSLSASWSGPPSTPRKKSVTESLLRSPAARHRKAADPASPTSAATSRKVPSRRFW